MSMPPPGEAMNGQALGCPVKSYRQIALPRARRALLDPHGIDAFAVRPGLGGRFGFFLMFGDEVAH